MLSVLPPDTEISWMNSEMVKLNCLTLGELYNEPIFKKEKCSFNQSTEINRYDQLISKLGQQ